MNHISGELRNKDALLRIREKCYHYYVTEKFEVKRKSDNNISA